MCAGGRWRQGEVGLTSGGCRIGGRELGSGGWGVSWEVGGWYNDQSGISAEIEALSVDKAWH